MGFYDTIIAVDHLLNKCWIISSGFPETSHSLRIKRAYNRIKTFIHKMSLNSQRVTPFKKSLSFPLYSNFTHEQYIKAIEKAKQYIEAGDIYQVNLSQRFECEQLIHPFSLYCRLRQTNPAPFSAFFNLNDHYILSSSPERFLRITGSKVQTRPIKGTSPRGFNLKEDKTKKKNLLNSSKDKAELIMIVDLERNDLGRVCKFGTIRVPELITLESYSTVFHLVSTVEGELLDSKNHVDCIMACFPGG